MKNKKTKWLALSIILVLSIIIIGGYSKKKLDNPNPTSYIFKANVEQVKNAIKNSIGDYQIKCMALYFKDEIELDIFLKTENKDDAFLRSFLCSPESKIYFRFGKPLSYSVDFHIHLDSISENKTKVNIFTLNPKICTWGFPFGSTGHGYSHMKKVPPSTIEEYEILLTIGKYLGEKDMPPCNYPKKW